MSGTNLTLTGINGVSSDAIDLSGVSNGVSEISFDDGSSNNSFIVNVNNSSGKIQEITITRPAGLNAISCDYFDWDTSDGFNANLPIVESVSGTVSNGNLVITVNGVSSGDIPLPESGLQELSPYMEISDLNITLKSQLSYSGGYLLTKFSSDSLQLAITGGKYYSKFPQGIAKSANSGKSGEYINTSNTTTFSETTMADTLFNAFTQLINTISTQIGEFDFIPFLLIDSNTTEVPLNVDYKYNSKNYTNNMNICMTYRSGGQPWTIVMIGLVVLE